MQNLNSPAIVHGPLSESELDRRAYIPRGCDAQGRYPQAAECCTELGADDEPLLPLSPPEAALVCVIAVALGGVMSGALVAIYASEIAAFAMQVWKVAS